MPRPDGGSLDDDLPHPLHDGDRVVAGPSGRARDEEDEIGFSGGPFERRCEKLGVVSHDGGADSHAAGLLDHCTEHERVRVHELPRCELSAHRHELVAGRQDRHGGALPGEDRRLSRRGGNGEVGGAEAATGLEQQIARRNVLAHLANVGVGDRLVLDGRSCRQDDVLAPDDRIRPGRQRIAGVDEVERGRVEGDRGTGRRARRDGDAVHGGCVEGGRRPARDDARGGHPSDGGRQVDRLGRKQLQAAGPTEGREPGVTRGRDVGVAESGSSHVRPDRQPRGRADTVAAR